MDKLLEQSKVSLIYVVASTSTFVLNKYLTNTLGFSSHYLLIIIQAFLIILIVYTQLIFLSTQIEYLNIKKWYLISVMLSILMFTNLKAIHYIPLTIFTLYKNSSVILTAFLEFKIFRKRISIIGYVSFILMITSLIVGSYDQKIGVPGYLWMGSNIIITSVYIVYLKKVMIIDDSSRVESVFFTNLLSIPLLSVMSFSFDKFAPIKFNTTMACCIFLSSLSAFLTSYSTAWAARILSSTSYAMLGAANKIALSLSGFILFEEKFQRRIAISLFIGLSSAFVYSLDAVKQTRSASSVQIRS